MSDRERPPIPEPTKRAVRQRCGFGCVLCGAPLCEYDHLVPWAERQAHEEENLVLLCAQHHAEKTKGLLPHDALAAAMAHPYNLQSGLSRPHALHYAGSACEAIIGSNVHVWPELSECAVTIPLLIDDIPIVLFRVESGRLLLSLQFLARDGTLLVQVRDNELIFSAAAWDVHFEGSRLTVRHALGDIFVSIDFQPPHRVVIDRGHLWANGIEVALQPDRAVIAGATFSGNVTACPVGIALGATPPGVPCGFAGMFAARVEGAPFASDMRLLRMMPPICSASAKA